MQIGDTPCVFPRCVKRPIHRQGNRAQSHKFPAEQAIRDKWVSWVKETCGLSTFIPHNSSRLCYRHFVAGDYRPSGRLLPDSYPSRTPEDLDKEERSLYDSSEGADSSDNTEIARWQFVDCSGSAELITEFKVESFSELSSDTENQTNEPANEPSTYEVLINEPSTYEVLINEPSTNEPSTKQPADSLDQVSPRAGRMKRRKSVPGDLSLNDFLSPRQAVQNFILMKHALKASRAKSRKLQMRIMRAVKKVGDLQSLIERLKEKDSISVDGYREVQVLTKHILSALNYYGNEQSK